MKWPLRLLRKLGRTALLLAMVAAGTILLMRFAPGYFSDAREMDAKYVDSAQAQISVERSERGSVAAIARNTVGGWLQGDLGRSRQYEVPVRDLIGPRLGITSWLVVRGVLFGWLLALCAALPLSATRSKKAIFSMPFTILLSVPTGAMATFCLLSGFGGPAFVMMLLLASRDFKFLYRTLRQAWRAPHLLIARAQGLPMHRLAWVHLLPNVWPQMLALAMLSFVTALSAVIPLEVIFDEPGLGKLAWTAAMNRDLPVLMASTMLMATAIALVGTFSDGMPFKEGSMRPTLAFSLLMLLLVAATAVLLIPGASYSSQDRDNTMAGSSPGHIAGTDQLGRDRMVRTAAAMLLGIAGASLASATTTAIAAMVGAMAAFSPAWIASGIMLLLDVFLVLPWLFLLMMVRSGLSLTVSPLHSAAVTFMLLAALGWPACAKAVYRGVLALRSSEGLTYGRANGLRTRQLVRLHVLPHLRPLLLPQFLVCVPAFIAAEANLGTLGLGITEPLPSWGSMLQELDNSALIATSHWIYLPLILLVVVLLLLESMIAEPLEG